MGLHNCPKCHAPQPRRGAAAAAEGADSPLTHSLREDHRNVRKGLANLENDHGSGLIDNPKWRGDKEAEPAEPGPEPDTRCRSIQGRFKGRFRPAPEPDPNTPEHPPERVTP